EVKNRRAPSRMAGSRRSAGKKEMAVVERLRATRRTTSRTAPGSWRKRSQAEAAGIRASANSEAAHGDSQGNCVRASPKAETLTAIAPSIGHQSFVISHQSLADD